MVCASQRSPPAAGRGPRAASRGQRAGPATCATGVRSFVGNWRIHAADARARRPAVRSARLMLIKRQPLVRGDVACRHGDPWRYRRRPQAGRSVPLPSGAGREPSQPGSGAAVTYRRWSGRRYGPPSYFGPDILQIYSIVTLKMRVVIVWMHWLASSARQKPVAATRSILPTQPVMT